MLKSPETRQASERQNIGDINVVGLIRNSSDYQANYQALAHTNLDPFQMNKAAISQSLENYLDNHQRESGYRSLTEHIMNVTYQLLSAEDHIHKIAELEQRGAKRNEKLPTLQALVEFNHSVKDMIDSNPSIKFPDMMRFLAKTNLQVNGHEKNSEEFNQAIRGVLDGMRHEIGVEQMLGHLDNVEYLEAEVEDDLKGGDILVSVDGGDYIPLDIKASPFSAARAQEKARRNGFSGNNIIWSQLDNEDFNGGFRVDYGIAAHKAKYLAAELARVTGRQVKLVA
ncbi:hypothetical protein B7Y94_05855 [Candidatus Saccharibacteria bacterium 32-49-12]|nr:MAG: hypothetical protein B7Y94_05855 [Candidatus Saccharibacteria bacterium 32-49-12]